MALSEDIVKFVSNKDRAASMLQVAALRVIVAGCRGEARWTGIEYPKIGSQDIQSYVTSKPKVSTRDRS